MGLAFRISGMHSLITQLYVFGKGCLFYFIILFREKNALDANSTRFVLVTLKQQNNLSLSSFRIVLQKKQTLMEYELILTMPL